MARRILTLPLLGVLLATGPASAQQIGVTVNGRPVTFGAVQPTKVGGSVLIPLRAVVESLGADIKWEAATQTVRGSKGSREFSLQINSRNAVVNGQPVALSVPAQMLSGTTMVPLRFVAEALGAEVEWNAAARQVVINAGEQEAPAPGGRLTGEVVAVKGDQITVLVDGLRQTFRVGQDAIILRGLDGSRGSAVGIEDIKPGDRVRLRTDATGAIAETIEASFPKAAPMPEPPPPVVANRDLEGDVLAVRQRGNVRTITIRTEAGRQTFDVAEDADIQRGVGNQRPRRSTLENIRVGDRVKLRADRGIATRLEAMGEAGDAEELVKGEIVAVRQTGVIVRTATDRALYEVPRTTRIFRDAGDGKRNRVDLADLKVGDQVTVRTDPTGSIAEEIDARAEAVAENLNLAQDLKITTFTHDGAEMLRAGSRVALVLTGTPGAIVTVDAGNFAKGEQLREDAQRPGRYTGTLLIPKGLTAKDVPVIAQLRIGNRTAPLTQAGTLLNVDGEAPVISDAYPTDRADVTNQQPDIYAEFSDGAGSGVDVQSLKVLVGNRDVTEEVKVTKRFLLYTPKTALQPGRVPVVVTLRDVAGNESRAEWEFTVRRAPVVLQSVTHDADRPLRAGEVVTITARGQPRGKATFTIGDVVRAAPLTESEPGVYVGKYTVRRGDDLAKAPVQVDFVSADGTRVKQEGTLPITFATTPAAPPKITFPGEMLRLEDELVVEGTGTAGTKILVEVTYRGRAFGALAVKGTFGTQEVLVDKAGKWKTDPFEVRLPIGTKRPELTITARSVDAGGTESAPTTLIVTVR
jgi:hypothetical protein